MYMQHQTGESSIDQRFNGHYDMNKSMLINMKIDTSDSYHQEKLAGHDSYYYGQDKAGRGQEKFTMTSQSRFCPSDTKQGLKLDRITSEINARSKKVETKHLPLSIANILGQIESDNEMENDDREEEDCDIQVCDEDTGNAEMDLKVEIQDRECSSHDDDTKECKDATDKQNAAKVAGGKASTDKQTPSYTAIIAQAILSAPDKKLPLGSIYDYIAEHFPEFLKKGQGWRNCVRHNLSLSECFIKAGRARNGRGNYWGIHPRYLKNFSKGDFRKRRASHRPRNRDFALGLTADHRLHYPHLISPLMFSNPLPASQNHRSFSVDSILSADRGNSAFNTYKPWITKPEMQRITNQCVPSMPWLEQKIHTPIHYSPLFTGLQMSNDHNARHYELLHRSDLVSWKDSNFQRCGLDYY